jgi:small subunit ribosomal protein S1
MTLFDDNTPHNMDSATSTLTEHSEDSPDNALSTDTVSAPEHSSLPDEKHAATEDFASALESFTTETEEAVREDKILTGTVLKLTGSHVVVDIGAKSEGMLPLAEVLDHDGKPRFQPGDEIPVMRDKGETEEGYISLSHLKARKLRS